MAEDERQPGVLQIAVHDVQIGTADSAGPYFEQNLISLGFRPRHLGQPQRLALGVQKHGFHAHLQQ
jgi:hypothetical protein